MSHAQDPEWDPDVPDRSHGDLYCGPCDAHMNSDLMWEAHILGKRHLKHAKKGETVESKFEFVDEYPLIQKDIDALDATLVGLDHLCEIQRLEQGPIYNCFLCSANIATKTQVLEHIVSTKHLMAYMKQHMPREYDLINNTEIAKSHLPNILVEHIVNENKRVGTGRMRVKREKPDFDTPPPPKIFKKGNGAPSRFAGDRGSYRQWEKRPFDRPSSRSPHREDRFDFREREPSRFRGDRDDYFRDERRRDRDDFERDDRRRERDDYDREERRLAREDFEREERRLEMEREQIEREHEILKYRRERALEETLLDRTREGDSFHPRTVIMDDSRGVSRRLDSGHMHPPSFGHEDSRPPDLRGRLEEMKEQSRSSTMAASNDNPSDSALDTLLRMSVNKHMALLLYKLNTLPSDCEFDEKYVEQVISKLDALCMEKRNRRKAGNASPLLLEKFQQSMAKSGIQPAEVDSSSNIAQLIKECRNQIAQSDNAPHGFGGPSARGPHSRPFQNPPFNKDGPWNRPPGPNQFNFGPNSTPIPGLTLTEGPVSYPPPGMLPFGGPHIRNFFRPNLNMNRFGGPPFKR